MLARMFAIVVAAISIAGPGVYLLHYAWRRGGNPRRFAIATLALALLLIGWLFFAPYNDATIQERITRFVGAWGILFMAVGLITALATVIQMLRAYRKRR